MPKRFWGTGEQLHFLREVFADYVHAKKVGKRGSCGALKKIRGQWDEQWPEGDDQAKRKIHKVSS